MEIFFTNPLSPLIILYFGATYGSVPNQLCGTFCGSKPAAPSSSPNNLLLRVVVDDVGVVWCAVCGEGERQKLLPRLFKRMKNCV